MKPILFNTPMVQAIQAGRKTVTRRVIKYSCPAKPGSTLDDFIGAGDPQLLVGCSPYQPGDILWVRETWCKYNGYFHYKESEISNDSKWLEGKNIKWRPSIHMPKEAARLFLRVTGVRAERLFDATYEDARNKGFQNRVELIEVIHRLYPEAGENPWVWVIEFERISKEAALGGGGEHG